MNTSMGSIGTWLLGGALVASLGWNALASRRATARESGRDTCNCISAVEKLEASGGLCLTAEKKRELIDLLRQCDAQSAGADARAAEIARELRSLLCDSAADPAAVRALAKELGVVRAEAIEACVSSSLQLRTMLTPEQLGRFLDACYGEECERSCGGAR
jgi:hypothetical protein